jgi:WD40 repeat protein
MLFSLARGSARSIVPPRPGDLVAAALSSGGRLAAAAYIVPRPKARSGDGGTVLLVGTTGKHVVPFDEPVFELDVSADGRFAVACTYAEAIVLDGATGQAMMRFAGAKVAALSRDGRLIALAMNGERKHDPPVISVRERETQRELATFSGHSRAVRDLAFSPEGDVVVTASRDGLLKRWRVP